MKSETRARRAQAYSELFVGLKGDPRARVRRIAARYGVQPQSVLNALRRYWGVEEFRRRIPAKTAAGSHKGPTARDYVAAYSKLRGSPASRVKQLAKRFGVKETSVKSQLRHGMGQKRFQQEFPRTTTDPQEIARMLNEKDLWRSRNAVAVVAKKLGLTPNAMKTKMYRWRIVRGPYVVLED